LFDSSTELDDWAIVWQSEGLDVEPVWADDELGYVRLWVPFAQPNQAVQFGLSYPEESAADLTGRTLRVRLRLAAGGGSGGVQLFSQSDGWVWIAHGWTGFESLNEWTDLTLDLEADSGDFDPAAVLRVGLQLHSGAGPSFETDEVHIDSFVIE
jgi:hypothetical protein